MHIPAGMDPTDYCNECAQTLIAELGQPTEPMLDSVRGILQYIRCTPGATFQQVREYCEARADRVDLWPEWAKTRDSSITESGAALLIYQVMPAARQVQG